MANPAALERKWGLASCDHTPALLLLVNALPRLASELIDLSIDKEEGLSTPQ